MSEIARLFELIFPVPAILFTAVIVNADVPVMFRFCNQVSFKASMVDIAPPTVGVAVRLSVPKPPPIASFNVNVPILDPNVAFPVKTVAPIGAIVNVKELPIPLKSDVA